MLDSIDRLTCSDTVCIVGIGVAIKGLELTALFPGQRVTEIRGRISLYILYSMVLPSEKRRSLMVLYHIKPYVFVMLFSILATLLLFIQKQFVY